MTGDLLQWIAAGALLLLGWFLGYMHATKRREQAFQRSAARLGRAAR